MKGKGIEEDWSFQNWTFFGNYFHYWLFLAANTFSQNERKDDKEIVFGIKVRILRKKTRSNLWGRTTRTNYFLTSSIHFRNLRVNKLRTYKTDRQIWQNFAKGSPKCKESTMCRRPFFCCAITRTTASNSSTSFKNPYENAFFFCKINYSSSTTQWRRRRRQLKMSEVGFFSITFPNIFI